MTDPQQISFPGSGMQFAALTWGPAEGPLAVCVHGYPDTAWTWRHLGPRLAADGWRVIAPFQRGYGPTDLAPDGIYQIGALARDAITAHAANGGDERAVLVGHDWGATAAYAAASFAPGRFRRVVTLAVPPAPALFGNLTSPRGWLARLPLSLRQLRRSWYMGFQQIAGLSERSLDRLIPRLWADWSPGYDATEDLAHLFASLDTPARRTAALLYYRALAQPRHRSREYRPEQQHWRAVPRQPLLYLHGRTDGCMLAALAENGRALLPSNVELSIVEGAGHFLQLEQPDAVGDLIAGFLGGRVGGAGDPRWRTVPKVP